MHTDSYKEAQSKRGLTRHDSYNPNLVSVFISCSSVVKNTDRFSIILPEIILLTLRRFLSASIRVYLWLRFQRLAAGVLFVGGVGLVELPTGPEGVAVRLDPLCDGIEYSGIA